MQNNFKIYVVPLALALISYTLFLRNKDTVMSQIIRDTPFLADQKKQLYSDLLTETLKIGAVYIASFMLLVKK